MEGPSPFSKNGVLPVEHKYFTYVNIYIYIQTQTSVWRACNSSRFFLWRRCRRWIVGGSSTVGLLVACVGTNTSVLASSKKVCGIERSFHSRRLKTWRCARGRKQRFSDASPKKNKNIVFCIIKIIEKHRKIEKCEIQNNLQNKLFQKTLVILTLLISQLINQLNSHEISSQ